MKGKIINYTVVICFHINILQIIICNIYHMTVNTATHSQNVDFITEPQIVQHTIYAYVNAYVSENKSFFRLH